LLEAGTGTLWEHPIFLEPETEVRSEKVQGAVCQVHQLAGTDYNPGHSECAKVLGALCCSLKWLVAILMFCSNVSLVIQ